MLPSTHSLCPSFRRRLALLLTFAVLFNCLSPVVLPLSNKVFAAPLAPQPANTDFVRQILLPTKDIVYDKTSKKFYASVPSSAGARGNSITPIEPTTGALGTSVFIGSEPGRLAIADNGQYLYSYLEGAFSIRRFDLTTQTPGLQFPFQPYTVFDMAVLPGKPESLAVGTANYLAVYDNDVKRSNAPAISGAPTIEIAPTGDTLYTASPYSSSLNKYSVAANGLTFSSTTNIGGGTGGEFRLDNGRIYLASGQVIDASTGALLGTFPSVGYSPLVAPDSSAGRVYFLSTGTNYSSTTWTIRAYDINTFVFIGSMEIANVTGTPGSFQRWGANGLAFRATNTYNSTADSIYLVQTSLIPSAEPIPAPVATPTPVPSPTPSPTPSTSIRQLAQPANDIIYDPNRETLYATLPSLVGSKGNSILPIDPLTGTLGAQTFIGSEPMQMALTTDGQYLYTYLDGASAIRRLDLTTQQAGLQFQLGSDYYGLFRANDMITLPGKPESIAVATVLGKVTVYENGVALTNTVGSSTTYTLEAADTGNTFYGASYGSYHKFTLNSSGVTLAKTDNLLSGGDVRYSNGLLYTTGGKVIDPETGVYKGTFTGVDNYSTALVLPDAANGRVFFLTPTSINGTSAYLLRAYDINTFLMIGSVVIPGTVGRATSLLRWGTNGIAFRTTGSYDSSNLTTATGQIFIIQTALVNSSAPITNATPLPTPTPAATPLPPALDYTQLTLTTNDLAYDSARKKIMASVPGSVGAGGNSITPINPLTASAGTPVFVGSEPNKLAVSGDSLYVGLDGAGAIRRFDLATQTPGLQFSLGTNNSGQLKAYDLAALPGSPDSVAVARANNSYGGSIAVYDNGTQRTNVINTGNYAGAPIESLTSDTLYTRDSNFTGLQKLSATAQGLALGTSIPLPQSTTFIGDFRIDNGRAFFTGGHVVDLSTGKLVGRFSGAFNTYYSSNGYTLVAPDSANGRVYILYTTSTFSPYTVTIQAFDMNTFLPVGSIQIPNVAGIPTSFIRWGADGLAFRTGPVTSGLTGSVGNQVYLIRTSLVPSNEVIPANVKLETTTGSYNESTANATVNVLRMGDNSTAASVQYATSDGTAVAGSDYTQTSGTLNFAAGETSKTITIPLLNDNLYEGNETFSLTLSNASGAALSSPTTAVVTIVENDLKPSVSVQGFPYITEPNTGTLDVVYTVKLSNPSTQTVTMDYATSDGTAVAGSDFIQATGTLTFNPLETSKNITLQVKADEVNEGSETFYLDLKNSTNTQFAINYHIPLYISDPPPGVLSFKAGGYSVNEQDGNAVIPVQRTGGSGGTVSVSYATNGGTALTGQDFTQAVGTLTFAPGETLKNITIPIIDDTVQESNETLTVTLLSASGGATLAAPTTATLTILDNDEQKVELSEVNYTVTENDVAGVVTITVNRTGDASSAASVDYATSDQSGMTPCQTNGNGVASDRCDYATAVGTLRFAAGEKTKTVQIAIIDDLYMEPSEAFTITLRKPQGATLGATASSTVFIQDNDTQAATQNPIDDQGFFIREQYIDFLGRPPEEAGYNFWMDRMNNCPPGQVCDRIDTSQRFFQSDEFQERGLYVYRLYDAVLGRLPKYVEFVPDVARLNGFQSVAEQRASKDAYLSDLINKTEFRNIYGAFLSADGLTATNPTGFVDALCARAGITPAGRQSLINNLQSGAKDPAHTVEDFILTPELSGKGTKFYDRGFITMQYFGYLRRDPEQAGFDFWVSQLIGESAPHKQDYRFMVGGFLQSDEYRFRFALISAH